ncbi:MAG TPA: FAD/NAD(P)-binding protein, partial [Nevskiaceae bacterium]|nr:FAD/NAD(P)-binding protein [Nevskiaceae bacterium]
MRNILIIGAGFCGTMAAVQLLRQPPPGPIRIILLNRSGLMARGVAYGTRTERHVLNVPAARMSALPGHEDDFLRYAQQHDARITGASFVPRQLYGQYLEHLLTEAARAVPAGCSFRSMVGEATRIRVGAGGRSALVELDHGETIHADRVILALGNYSPAHPKVDEDSRAFFRSPRYVQDAWRPEALRVARMDQPVLLIGTGLTMLDVLLDLQARGQRAPVHALSRRGLLPLAHRELDTPPPPVNLLPDCLGAGGSVRRCLRALRRKVAEVTAQGGDWRDVIGALRPHTPALWHQLGTVERRRFLRHLRSFWDLHRHRCAPELGAALRESVERGELRVIAGRLVAFDEQADGVDVIYRPRGARDTQRLRVSTVINCTGPEHDTRTLREPLLAHLRASGLMVPDELGLGFLTDANYALRDLRGEASRVLFYAGPFLRAQHWEATAVPELRVH